MSIFAMGFLFIMIFTMLVGVGAMVFLSFDGETAKQSAGKQTTTRLFEVVRRINTTTIETIDKSGTVQEWTRSK